MKLLTESTLCDVAERLAQELPLKKETFHKNTTYQGAKYFLYFENNDEVSTLQYHDRISDIGFTEHSGEISAHYSTAPKHIPAQITMLRLSETRIGTKLARKLSQRKEEHTDKVIEHTHQIDPDEVYVLLKHVIDDNT